MCERTNDHLLSPDKAREIFDYCPLSGEIYWRHRKDAPAHWNNRYAGKVAGTEKKGYVQICLQIDGKNRFFSGQRLIWVLFYGQWPEGEVDHRDHDTMNNSIMNLREATHSENSTHKKELRGKIPFKGVYFMRSKGRFAAQIKSNGNHYWLGLYDSAECAAFAYDLAASIIHGSFSKNNLEMGLL